jgi:deoxycytidine triphosphate deaminase
MSIKSDKWIRRMAQERHMIEPFAPEQVRHSETGPIISYGTSSYGYDVRCAREFKIFTNINSTIVDPKQFDEKSFVDLSADVCIIPPNSFALARTVEYLRIPRNVLVVTVGKSTYARCFHGATRVALVDGSSVALEDMARRNADGELFWGYSVGPNGRVIVSLLDAPRCVGRDALIEVTLDDGQKIQATPDHFFIRRDGLTTQAGELRPGDSLMPLYRDLRRGYEYVYQPINGHLLATHRLADEWNLRHGIYEAAPGTHRHHSDFDRRNNKPMNLERMEASDHIGLQSREQFSLVQQARAVRFWDDERYSAIRTGLLERRRHPTEATRQAHRATMLKRYQDPLEVERHSARMRRAWAGDDSRRCRQAEVARTINLRPEITPEVVRHALDHTGSIRGAARYLNCDRSVFRRFPELISSFHGTPGRNHKVAAIRELPGVHDVYCLTVPEAGNFALEAGVFVKNCGIIVNVTPLEPEWEGHVTLEFSNTTPLPAKIYANEGVAQVLFFESDEVCETSYADRAGKYQGQRGVTLPKA